MINEKLFKRDVILRLAGLTDVNTPLHGSGLLHRHSFWQINMVFEGGAMLILPRTKQILGPGDILILPPNCNHYIDYASCSRHRGLSLKFDWKNSSFDDESQFLLINGKEPEQHLFNAVLELCRGFIPQVINNPNRQYSISSGNFRQILLEDMLSGILNYYCNMQENFRGGDFLFRLREFIARRNGLPVSVGELAEFTGYSEGHLRLLIKEKLQISPKEFIDRERLAIICNYLCYSALNIRELSLKLGFCNEIYFNKFFRKHMNMSPLKYRRQAQDNILKLQ